MRGRASTGEAGRVLIESVDADPFGLVGQLFDGTYRIIRVVGGGSFGVVYEAEHQKLAKRCALKVLKLEGLRNPEVAVERFWREARTCEALKDAGAIAVHDARVEQPHGRLYFAMDLLNGVSLHTPWMSAPERRMAPVEALGCIRQVASCMAVAHEAGIVHRDLKPENIFICRDHTVKVLDFGCALIRSEPRLTAPGHVIGLPYYMPPDQLDYLRTTPDLRVDIYALGVTLYHILSGRWVYPLHHDPLVVAKHVLVAPPTDIGTVAPFLPPSVLALVRRAMARNPDDRFQTMRDLEDAIGRVLRSGEVELRVSPDASTLARTAPRRSPVRTLLERLGRASLPVAHAPASASGAGAQGQAAPPSAQNLVDNRHAPARRAPSRDAVAPSNAAHRERRPASQPPRAAERPRRSIRARVLVVAAAGASVIGTGGWLAMRHTLRSTPALPESRVAEPKEAAPSMEHPVSTHAAVAASSSPVMMAAQPHVIGGKAEAPRRRKTDRAPEALQQNSTQAKTAPATTIDDDNGLAPLPQ
jgi:serine/threonine protein kinase